MSRCAGDARGPTGISGPASGIPVIKNLSLQAQLIRVDPGQEDSPVETSADYLLRKKITQNACKSACKSQNCPDPYVKRANSIPMGSMYAIYGNIYHQYTPNVSIYIYIYHTWILWDMSRLPVWVSGAPRNSTATIVFRPGAARSAASTFRVAK